MVENTKSAVEEDLDVLSLAGSSFDEQNANEAALFNWLNSGRDKGAEATENSALLSWFNQTSNTD